MSSLLGMKGLTVVNLIHSHTHVGSHFHSHHDKVLKHSIMDLHASDFNTVKKFNNKKNANPLHSHILIKTTSFNFIEIKIVDNISIPYPIHEKITFSHFDISTQDIYLPKNIRPPIFS